MSADNILDILAEEGYPTGILKVYYDFSTFNGSKLANDSVLDPTFSGRLFSTGSIADAESLSSAAISGSGYHFFGGAIKTGQTNWNYLKLQNANLLESETFTLLFAGGPRRADFFNNESRYTGNWAASSGRAYDRYPILTNRETGLFCADGWEVGLNAANRLYFECYGPQSLSPFSISHKSNGPRDNIWAVRYDGQNIGLGRFDIFDNSFNFENEVLGELEAGQNWYIGSGFGNLTKLTTGYSGNSLVGNLSRVLYFEQDIDDATLSDIALNMFGDCAFTTETTTGFSGIGTGITGSGVTYISGVTGYTYTVQNSTGSQAVSFDYFSPLTGTVATGASYYIPFTSILGLSYEYNSGSVSLYESIVNTGSATTGVTGFQLFTGNGVEVTGFTGIIQTFVPLSGIVGQNVDYYFGTGTGSFGLGDEELECISNLPSRFLPRSRTYVDEKFWTGDFVEHLTGLIQSGELFVNKDATVGMSHYFPSKTAYLQDDYAQTGVNLFINGVARWASGITINDRVSTIIEFISGDSYYVRDCNGQETINIGDIQEILRETAERQYVLQGDWFLTGVEVLEATRMYDDTFNLNPTYDHSQFGIRTLITVTGLAGHTGIKNTNYTSLITDNVFFNGQKLVSGEHFTGNYNGSYTEFRPFGWITGETGVYFTFPRYTGQASYTGRATYDIYDRTFWPKSIDSFINGVRVDKDEFVEHDSSVDMITGADFTINGGVLVYVRN